MARMQITDATASKFVNSTLTTTDDVGTLRLRALILGDFGSGKTTLFGTAPKPIILDPEGGTLPLRGRNLARIPVTSWREVFEALHWIATAEHDYQTVCIDDLHEIQQFDLDFLMKEAGKDRMNQDLWGLAKRQGKTLCSWLIGIQQKRNMHVIVNVNHRTETDDDGKIINVIPDLQGAFREQVCRSFHMIGYLIAKEQPAEDENKPPEITRRVVVWPYGPHKKAKDRYSPKELGRSILDIEGGPPGICIPDAGLWIHRIEDAGIDSVVSEAEALVTPDEIAEVEAAPEPEVVKPKPKARAKAKTKPKVKAETELDLEEPSSDGPSVDELKATLVGAYNGYKDADAQHDEEGYEPFAPKVANVIRAHLKEAGAKNLGEVEHGSVIQAMIAEIEQLESTRLLPQEG